jgi:hypothetical protein
MDRQTEAPALFHQRTGRGCLSEATGNPIVAQPPAQNHLGPNRLVAECNPHRGIACGAGSFVTRWQLLLPNWCTEAQAVALTALIWGVRA